MAVPPAELLKAVDDCDAKPLVSTCVKGSVKLSREPTLAIAEGD